MTETITLNLETAIELVARAVTERGPDYVYKKPDAPEENTYPPSCLNWHPSENRPGCIVGLALSYLVGEDKVKAHVTGGSSSLLQWLDIDASLMVLHYLGRVQRSQDDKNRWGQAAIDGLTFVYDEALRNAQPEEG